MTVIVARHGWARDGAHRDDSLRAECVQALYRLIQARHAPLSGQAWDAFAGVSANEHHIGAIAAMNAVSASQRDHELVRLVARQTSALQQEAIRYRKSTEAQEDRNAHRVGRRRGAIFGAATMMQEDLLLWQRGGTRVHIKSFWRHYAAQLLDRM